MLGTRDGSDAAEESYGQFYPALTKTHRFSCFGFCFFTNSYSIESISVSSFTCLDSFNSSKYTKWCENLGDWTHLPAVLQAVIS